MSNFRWLVDNVPFKRNPDSYSLKPVAPNVQYTIQASGRQTRTQARRVLSANVLTLNWHSADAILHRSIAILTQKSALSKIVIVGTKPTISVWAYLDTPELNSSQDQFERKPGNAGHRRDIVLTGQTDEPYFHSYYNVPSDLIVNSSFVQNSFLGTFGISSYDSVPNWNGFGWRQVMTLNQPVHISNMGTAEWEPYVRINGPFSTFAMNAAYEDVDGTGAGINFTWLGNAVADHDFILFDTASGRVFKSTSGSINQVYTFTITTRSNGQPFAYWPPAPMGEFVVTPIALAGTGADTTIDYSNNGTETFRYR